MPQHPLLRSVCIDRSFYRLLTEALELSNTDVSHIPLHDQVIHFASVKSIDVPVHPDNVVHFKDVKINKNAK